MKMERSDWAAGSMIEKWSWQFVGRLAQRWMSFMTDSASGCDSPDSST